MTIQSLNQPRKLSWSGPYPLDKISIRQNAPKNAGVYLILQSKPYPRYRGRTPILKIGRSGVNLANELENHIDSGPHTARPRLMRIKNSAKVDLTFLFVSTTSVASKELERQLHRQFEDRHWDLPLLSSQRGYRRGEDRNGLTISAGSNAVRSV